MERVIEALKDFHSRMVKLDSLTLFQTTSLQEMVDEKIKEQSSKIIAMTETFKEALMLSNKTYFLEEMSKQKSIQKDLKNKLAVSQEKIKTLQG